MYHFVLVWKLLVYIVFTSYEQPIRISNFCNKFLFPFFVSKYWQDKCFKLRPKYMEKCQYIYLHRKRIKTLCNTLNWGCWNSRFVKLVVLWVERYICLLVTYLQCEGVRATNDTNKPKTPETPKITPVQNPVPISEIFSKLSIFQLEPE